MSDHLDLDTLADALTDPRAGQPHLSQCAACSSRLGELEAAESDVRASLAALPVPIVPDDLVDRIAAALASEAPLAVTSRTGLNRHGTTGAAAELPGRDGAEVGSGRVSGSGGVSGSHTVTPLLRPRRVSVGRWLPAAAAAVVLLGIAGLGYAAVSAGRGGSSTSASAGSAAVATAAPSPAPSYPTSESGTDWASRPAASRVLAGVLAGGLRGRADTTALSASSGASTPDTKASPAASIQPFAAAATALSGLHRPAALAGCLAGLGLDSPPLALDYARYSGRPALAVVASDPDPAKVAVYVVGPDCAQADPALVLFTRLDRPA